MRVLDVWIGGLLSLSSAAVAHEDAVTTGYFPTLWTLLICAVCVLFISRSLILLCWKPACRKTLILSGFI